MKIVASALTLGSGGSGGREGPIAQIGAGFGSLLGNLLHLRPAERRVLMAAGMGAGIGGWIFRAPLAGTIFAAEVMYSSPEFESEVIIPAGIASVISYCVYGVYSGWEPLFTMPSLSFTNPLRLGPYLLLALFMALLAMLYTHSFYGVKRLFDRLPIHRHFRPALGAFLTGLVACILYFIMGRNAQVLAVLSFGYSLLLPSLWVCTLSYIISDKQSIYSSQVEGRSLSPAHRGTYVRQVLAGVRVSQFLSPEQSVTVLRPVDSLMTVIERLSKAPYPVLPVVDEENRLLGVVNIEEVHLASQSPSLTPFVPAADLMAKRCTTADSRG